MGLGVGVGSEVLRRKVWYGLKMVVMLVVEFEGSSGSASVEPLRYTISNFERRRQTHEQVERNEHYYGEETAQSKQLKRHSVEVEQLHR